MTPEEVIAQAIEDDDRNNTVSLDLPDDEFHAALLKSSVKAILTALSTAGFVVVPREPTMKMYAAADALDYGIVTPLKIYKAMLSAYTPPTQNEGKA